MAGYDFGVRVVKRGTKTLGVFCFLFQSLTQNVSEHMFVREHEYRVSGVWEATPIQGKIRGWIFRGNNAVNHKVTKKIDTDTLN